MLYLERVHGKHNFRILASMTIISSGFDYVDDTYKNVQHTKHIDTVQRNPNKSWKIVGIRQVKSSVYPLCYVFETRFAHRSGPECRRDLYIPCTLSHLGSPFSESSCYQSSSSSSSPASSEPLSESFSGDSSQGCSIWYCQM